MTIAVMEMKREEIESLLIQKLDAKRLEHTFAVCETAVVLAERFGADKNKAYLAALLHDCARGLDKEQLVNYCRENGIELDDYMKNDINPVHALVGADMAKRRFGIIEEDILSAIKNHAVGCANMTLLDKVIFVADGIEPNRKGSDADEARNAAVYSLDDAIVPVMRIKSYYLKDKSMHPNSIMMLEKLNQIKSAKSFSPYSDWVQKICSEKNIRINGPVTQIKDDKLFCISSDIGNLYLKKATTFIADELTFTLRLMELRIISLPKWIAYEHDMKVFLMRDMGGSDLSLLPLLNIETAKNVFIMLSRIQKESIQYVKSKELCGVDYRINTMLRELKNLPETAYSMLFDTQYRITRDEIKKLKKNINYVTSVLLSVKDLCLPDTIHHGDLGAYNVRIVDGESIFYDWGCGGVSHPFFDTCRLLSSIREKLPTDVPAKNMIVDTYIREWSEYGSYEELMNIFTAIDGLAGFYMAYVKYIRTKNVHTAAHTGNTKAVSEDGLGLNKRYETAAEYLKRFIKNEFTI